MTAQREPAWLEERISYLIRSGAHPGMSGPEDRELVLQFRLRRFLDPQYDARIRAIAGTKPKGARRPKSRAASPAARVLYNTADWANPQS